MSEEQNVNDEKNGVPPTLPEQVLPKIDFPPVAPDDTRMDIAPITGEEPNGTEDTRPHVSGATEITDPKYNTTFKVEGKPVTSDDTNAVALYTDVAQDQVNAGKLPADQKYGLVEGFYQRWLARRNKKSE